MVATISSFKDANPLCNKDEKLIAYDKSKEVKTTLEKENMNHTSHLVESCDNQKITTEKVHDPCSEQKKSKDPTVPYADNQDTVTKKHLDSCLEEQKAKDSSVDLSENNSSGNEKIYIPDLEEQTTKKTVDSTTEGENVSGTAAPLSIVDKIE